MRVGLEVSSLTTAHQVRGIGFYTQRLRDQLLKLAKIQADFSLVEVNGKPKTKLDLLHYPYFQPFFRTLPLFHSVPVVVTVHDLIPLKFPKHFPPGKRGKWHWHWQRLALKRAAAVITDSKASAADILQLAGIQAEKLAVIYLAADSLFQPIKNKRLLDRLRTRYQLPAKFVLYTGDLNWNKNVVVLAQACVDLGYPLVVVGKQAMAVGYDPDHPENQELAAFQRQAEAHPKEIIRLGFVPTGDLVGLYNLATCCAQPSRAEGFGLPVLEAMACGCPVVTAKTTSLAEIAGSAALLVDPTKPQELTKALHTMWQRVGVRRRLTSLGLKQAAQFSWEKTAQETFSVYQKVYHPDRG
jgi:glycosyltransferase involved in cell wall biosynthesis